MNRWPEFQLQNSAVKSSGGFEEHERPVVQLERDTDDKTKAPIAARGHAADQLVVRLRRPVRAFVLLVLEVQQADVRLLPPPVRIQDHGNRRSALVQQHDILDVEAEIRRLHLRPIRAESRIGRGTGERRRAHARTEVDGHRLATRGCRQHRSIRTWAVGPGIGPPRAVIRIIAAGNCGGEQDG